MNMKPRVPAPPFSSSGPHGLPSSRPGDGLHPALLEWSSSGADCAASHPSFSRGAGIYYSMGSMTDHDKKMVEIQEFLKKIRFKDISVAPCDASALHQDWRSAVIAKVYAEKELRFTGIRECLRRSFKRSAWNACSDPTIKQQGGPWGWSRPQRGWIKLNCDAAVGVANSSFGCIVRNEEGAFIVASWGTTTSIPLVAEFYAVYYGLMLLQSLNHCYVDIEIDCITVALLLQNVALSAPWRVVSISDKCRQLCKFYPHWRISHSPRDTNLAAHTLARESLNTNGNGQSLSIPDCILGVLHVDLQNSAKNLHQSVPANDSVLEMSVYNYGTVPVHLANPDVNSHSVQYCNSYV